MVEMMTKTLTVADPQNTDRLFTVFPLGDVPCWVSNRVGGGDRQRTFDYQRWQLAALLSGRVVPFDCYIVIDGKKDSFYWKGEGFISQEEQKLLRGIETALGYPPVSKRADRTSKKCDAAFKKWIDAGNTLGVDLMPKGLIKLTERVETHHVHLSGVRSRRY